MTVDVRIPPLPESVQDATLLAWNFRAGDRVERGDVLVELETDKVVLEVPAPEAGVLAEIVLAEGETGVGDELIARIDPAGAGTAAGAGSAGASPDGAGAAAHEPDAPAPASAAPTASVSPVAAGTPTAGTPVGAGGGSAGAGSGPAMGPAARLLVAEHGLDPAAIAGTGKDGRVTKADVLRHLEASPRARTPDGAGADGADGPPTVSSPAPASAPAHAPGAASASASAPGAAPASASAAAPGAASDAAPRGERREPMSRLRRRIASRLLEAQHTTASLTTFNEVNMQPVLALRSRYREEFERRHGVRLGLMPFFVKAAVQALERFPPVNAFIDGEDVVYHDYCDVGVAVGAPRGLVVPVLRNAERLSFAAIEQAVADFGARARDGSLTLEELTGGTFTISNGGVFGSLLSTPILNPPQSAILGMHKTQPRPVADEDGAVVVRPMMYLALSYDHRIVDGREAVQFLVTIKDALEDPARLLLSV